MIFFCSSALSSESKGSLTSYPSFAFVFKACDCVAASHWLRPRALPPEEEGCSRHVAASRWQEQGSMSACCSGVPSSKHKGSLERSCFALTCWGGPHDWNIDESLHHAQAGILGWCSREEKCCCSLFLVAAPANWALQLSNTRPPAKTCW